MKPFFQRVLAALSGPQYNEGPLAGVRYFYGSWQQVLVEANHQNKPIFLDFHTIGFYPRQQIARQAALDPSLAQKFNAQFINYLVDAKAGEGRDIARRYRMHRSAVPTALFILGDGSLLYRASGYEGVKGLLAEADKAIEATNEPNQLAILEQDYVGGKRDLAFLRAYLAERSRADMPNQEALLAYLSLISPTDWTGQETIRLIIGNLTTYQSEPVNALQQTLRQLTNSLDSSSVYLGRQISERIRELIRIRFHQAIAEQDERQLAWVIAANEQFLRAERGDQLSQPELDKMATGFRRRYYADTKNLDQYRPLAEAEAWRLMTIPLDLVREKDQLAYQRYLDRKETLDAQGEGQDYANNYAQSMSTFESRDMAHRLNRIVHYYADNMTDPADLEQALTWSARSLAFDPCPGYLHLHARLLIRLGRSREADEVLRQVSASQMPGTHQIHVSIKRPEDYEW
jgi:hypothetical protein